MEIRIAYRIMYSQYWCMMHPLFQHSRIVPCEYAVMLDGVKTFTSSNYNEVVSVAKRLRNYEGTIA